MRADSALRAERPREGQSRVAEQVGPRHMPPPQALVASCGEGLSASSSLGRNQIDAATARRASLVRYTKSEPLTSAARMTKLSVNVNKVATVRNARGGSEPDVVNAARLCLEAGAGGITVHPRPDG